MIGVGGTDGWDKGRKLNLMIDYGSYGLKTVEGDNHADSQPL